MDKVCPNLHHEIADGSLCTLCRSTPLMRSNDKKIFVCVCCDKEYDVVSFDDYVNSLKSPAASGTTENTAKSTPPVNNDIPSKSFPKHDELAKSNTAPQKAVESPDEFESNNELDNFSSEDHEVFLRSSSLISQALLEGWQILSDICPCDGCNVPLIIHPR
jgi:hypothetical protein